MPCNCSRRAIQQTMQKVEREDKIKKQKEEIERLRKEYEVKKQNEINTLSHATTPSIISSIQITGGNLEINYKGGSEPSKTYSGLLAKTALEAAGGTLNDRFRSVGYFGIGFGGNNLTNGLASQNLSLADIDLSGYTHINVAFLAIEEDGHLSLPNSFSSRGTGVASHLPPWLLKFNSTYNTKYPTDTDLTDFTYVQEMMKEIKNQCSTNPSNTNNVKIIPSIGGWNIANNVGEGTKKYGQTLHDISKDISGTKYTKLKNNIQTLLTDKSIDGMDVDWEYPGREPITSMCVKGGSSTAYPCKVSDPTQIGPCDGTKPGCTSFAYESAEINGCPGETYRIPISTGGDTTTKVANNPPTYYSNFMKALKKDMLDKDPNAELSIACAGAPWGLHWYANTLASLLIDNTITYANIMAYDYQGFWSSGQISGFLANFTNFDNLDVCKPPSSEPCKPVKCVSCGGQAPCKGNTKCATWNNGITYSCIQQPCTGCTVCPDNMPVCEPGKANFFNNCPSIVKMTFKNTTSGNNLSPDTSPTDCPLTLYNQLGAGSLTKTPYQDVTDDQYNLFWKGTEGTEGTWYADNNVYSSSVTKSQYTPRMTLSIQTMLNIFTNVFKIPSKSLVIGLPYYGRTFQTGDASTEDVKPPSSSFSPGSYGLFQPYQYGTSYSFSDIYQKNYTGSNANKNVYSIKLSDKYTEEIVYAKGEDMLTQITSGMNEEMISYNSIGAIKTKVTYAHDNGYGGYMCWHMGSDYYEGVPTS
mgnify:CR=1 FL=1